MEDKGQSEEDEWNCRVIPSLMTVITVSYQLKRVASIFREPYIKIPPPFKSL